MKEIKFDRSTKWFFIVLGAVLVLSVLSSYHKHMILEDYEVFVEYDEAGNLIDLDLYDEDGNYIGDELEE